MGLDSEVANNIEPININKDFVDRKNLLTNLLKKQEEELIKKKESHQITIDSETNPELKEKKIQVFRNSENINQNGINKLSLKLSFLRPKKDFDVNERNWTYENLDKEIKKNCPDNLPLRFHGTSIYNSQKIIETGSLSSSVDRLGFTTSYDSENQISVSAPTNCDITTQSYTDLVTIDNYLIPSGCIFVVLPHSQEEAENSEFSLLMSNVDFKDNPKFLFGIITSTENKPIIKEWLTQANMNTDLVSTFQEFPQKLSNLKNEISGHPELLNEIIPYSTASTK